MDDVGGNIENVIFRKVKSSQIVFHTPKELSDAAMKLVPSIITVQLPRWDEIVDPESIHQAPSIPKTLSIHKFVQQINDREDCTIDFFQTAVDQEAFHTQWYNKASDVVCGHERTNKSDNELFCINMYRITQERFSYPRLPNLPLFFPFLVSDGMNINS